MTIIETIQQIYKNMPRSRIVVATPSNSSAYSITERIIDSGVVMPGEFLQLVGHNNMSRDTIPKKVSPYCGTIDIARVGTERCKYKVLKSGMQMNCNAAHLKARRILIGTCMTLGTLMQCDIPEDHFTHVIVDESGQCMETEAIIPMTLLEKATGQVITFLLMTHGSLKFFNKKKNFFFVLF